jgi:polar amino acid transport system substrate-binding protein
MNRLGVFAMVAATLMAPTAGAKNLAFITIDAAPWASRASDEAAPIGLFPDIVAELERRTGHTIRMTLNPFARISRELEAGHQDCTILIWNPDWLRFIEKGETVATHVVGVVLRKGLSVHRYEELHGLKLSVLRGLSVSKAFDADTTIDRDSDTDYLTGLRKIAHGRVDGMVGAIPTIRHLAKQEHLDGTLGDSFVIEEARLVLQCARASANIDALPSLNQAVRHMVSDGTVAALRKKHSFE